MNKLLVYEICFINFQPEEGEGGGNFPPPMMRGDE